MDNDRCKVLGLAGGDTEGSVGKLVVDGGGGYLHFCGRQDGACGLRCR